MQEKKKNLKITQVILHLINIQWQSCLYILASKNNFYIVIHNQN